MSEIALTFAPIDIRNLRQNKHLAANNRKKSNLLKRSDYYFFNLYFCLPDSQDYTLGNGQAFTSTCLRRYQDIVVRLKFFVSFLMFSRDMFEMYSCLPNNPYREKCC